MHFKIADKMWLFYELDFVRCGVDHISASHPPCQHRVAEVAHQQTRLELNRNYCFLPYGRQGYNVSGAQT